MDSYLFLIGFTLLSVLFFFLCWSPSLSSWMGFDVISSNIEEVLLIIRSANVFVFGDFNVDHKDWLAYSGRTGRFGEPSYNFSISNGLTCMINFLTQISDCDADNPALLDFFLLTLLVLILHWLFLH